MTNQNSASTGQIRTHFVAKLKLEPALTFRYHENKVKGELGWI